MQSQQQIRINAAPTTAALALIATLVLGGFGGYAIAIATKAPVAIPFTEQVVPSPTAPIFDEGRMCTADFKFCREPQNSYD